MGGFPTVVDSFTNCSSRKARFISSNDLNLPSPRSINSTLNLVQILHLLQTPYNLPSRCPVGEISFSNLQ